MSLSSNENRLEPINDTLNPKPNKFGMPWYVILVILTASVGVFMLPWVTCKVVGAFLCPASLGFGWWLCRNDPKEPMLIIHDLLLPSEFDPGK